MAVRMRASARAGRKGRPYSASRLTPDDGSRLIRMAFCPLALLPLEISRLTSDLEPSTVPPASAHIFARIARTSSTIGFSDVRAPRFLLRRGFM